MNFRSVSLPLFLLLLPVLAASGGCQNPTGPDLPTPPTDEKDERDEPQDPGFAFHVQEPHVDFGPLDVDLGPSDVDLGLRA